MEITYFAAVVVAGTPLLLATLGELLTEKVGNLNLGVEGIMLMGAIVGFSTGYSTGSPIMAILGAILAGAFGGLIYAFLTVSLRANQVVTGLALTIFGTGFSSFVGKSMLGVKLTNDFKAFFAPVNVPILSSIPVIGDIFFKQDVFIYMSYVIAIVLGVYLFFTRKGLNVRTVGENPGAADAAGINVTLYKYIHILTGGALCGLGGAYLSLVYVPVWQENITAGRGWIAVALVIFVVWNPFKAFLGAYIFGGLDIIGFRLQAYDIAISQYIIDMFPYLATIVVIILSATRNSKEKQPPKGLGVAYFREER